MIPNSKSKMTKLVMAFLIAGSISLVGTGQALAKKVVVRPGDRVVYKGYGSPVYNEPYSLNPPAPVSVPPPWAASWYRSRHWRNEGKDNWRHDWRWHRGARD